MLFQTLTHAHRETKGALDRASAEDEKLSSMTRKTLEIQVLRND